MKKRILSMLLVLVLMATLVPVSASAASVNDDSVFLTQQESVTCTLAASAMLLRRCAIMQGNSNWASITESSIASSAWINGIGLRGSFSYAGMNVARIVEMQILEDAGLCPTVHSSGVSIPRIKIRLFPVFLLTGLLRITRHRF